MFNKNKCLNDKILKEINLCLYYKRIFKIKKKSESFKPKYISTSLAVSASMQSLTAFRKISFIELQFLFSPHSMISDVLFKKILSKQTLQLSKIIPWRKFYLIDLLIIPKRTTKPIDKVNLKIFLFFSKNFSNNLIFMYPFNSF